MLDVKQAETPMFRRVKLWHILLVPFSFLLYYALVRESVGGPTEVISATSTTYADEDNNNNNNNNANDDAVAVSESLRPLAQKKKITMYGDNLCTVKGPEETGNNWLMYNRLAKAGSATLFSVLEHTNDREKVLLYKPIGAEYHAHAKGNTKQQKGWEKLEAIINNSSVHHAVYANHMDLFDFKALGFPEPVYIQLFRDPLARVQSAYYYEINGPRPKHKMLDAVRALKHATGLDHAPTLNEFLDALLKPLDDWEHQKLWDSHVKTFVEEGHLVKQIRVHPLTKDLKTSEQIEEAKKNIRDMFTVVGILEEIELTLQVMEQLIPGFFANAFYEYKNMKMKNVAPKTADTIPEWGVAKTPLRTEYVEWYQRVNRHDYEVYNYAKEYLYAQRNECLPPPFTIVDFKKKKTSVGTEEGGKDESALALTGDKDMQEREPLLIQNHIAKTGGSTFRSSFIKMKYVEPYLTTCETTASFGHVKSDVCESINKKIERTGNSCNFLSWERFSDNFEIHHVDGGTAGDDDEDVWFGKKDTCLLPNLGYRPVFYVAIVRDPVKHVISMLNHGYRGKREKNEQRNITEYVSDILDGEIDYSITYYIRSQSRQFENMQTKGNLAHLKRGEEIPTTRSDKVSVILNAYDAVAVTELYDASICLVLYQMSLMPEQCRADKVKSSNVKKSPLDGYITQHHIERFLENTKDDQRLFNEAVKLVEKRIHYVEQVTNQTILLPGEVEKLTVY